MSNAYQSKYSAYDLQQRSGSSDGSRSATAHFDAVVDIWTTAGDASPAGTDKNRLILPRNEQALHILGEFDA